MAANRVLFLKGSSQNYALEVKNENAMYFCTDTKELYVGSIRFGLGDMGIKFIDASDGTTELTGDAINGKVVTKIEKDPSTNYRTLKVFLGTGVTSAAKEEIIAAIDAMTPDSTVIEYISDGTDPDGEYGALDLKVAPNTQGGAEIGEVVFSKGANGLSAEVDVGVKGVKTGDKVISLDANKELSSTLSLAYDNTGTTPLLKILGIGGAEVATLDATPFIKDGMLDSASLVSGTTANTETSSTDYIADHTYLKLVFNTVKESASGSATPAHETIYLDVTELIDVYTAGAGIDITGNVVKLDHTPITAESSDTKTATVAVGGSTTISYVKYDVNGLVTGTGTLTLNVSGLTGGTVGGTNKIVTSATLGTDGALTGNTLDVMTDGQPSDANTAAMDLTTALSSTDKAKIPTAEVVYDTVEDAIAVWSTFGS